MAGIPHKMIYEPDPPVSGQLTAIGLVPSFRTKEMRSILSRLPKLKETVVRGEASQMDGTVRP